MKEDDSTHLKAVWLADKLNSILLRGNPDVLGYLISASEIMAKATPEEISFYYYGIKEEC